MEQMKIGGIAGDDKDSMIEQQQKMMVNYSEKNYSDNIIGIEPALKIPFTSSLKFMEDATKAVPKIVLDEAELWAKFYAIGNEMIINQNGR